MENFKTGFAKGDLISEYSNQHIKEGVTPRYVNVWNVNDGKDYTVGDNGERRERIFVNGSIKFGKVVKGKLSYNNIKIYF